MIERESVRQWLADLLSDDRATVTTLCGKYVLAYDTGLLAGVVHEVVCDRNHVTMPISFPAFVQLLVERGCALPEGQAGYRWVEHCCTVTPPAGRQH